MRRTALSILLLILGIMILIMPACSSKNYKNNIHKINEEFSNICIKTDTADITFAMSNDETCTVSCYEDARKPHSVQVQNNTLTVNEDNDKKWYEYIGINIDSPKITVYLPKAEYSSLAIEESTGDVEIAKDFKFNSIDVSLTTGDVKCYASATETMKIVSTTGDVYTKGISANSLHIAVTTGNVTVSEMICNGDATIGLTTGKTHLANIVCKNLTSTGSTGDILLKNVISTEKIYVKRSTGDITLENSDATELFIKTTTGDVKGSLLTDKLFIAKSDTGRVNVPNSITGGRCEIIASTGDIKITISND